MDKFVKVDNLNALEVSMKSCSPMYTLVSYRAGYQQALKDIKKAYNDLTVYEFDLGPTAKDLAEVGKYMAKGIEEGLKQAEIITTS